MILSRIEMTKYIKEINDEAIAEVAEAIRAGKIVVFKTDTVYGIGTNAFDEKACERIYEVKRRPAYKPLSILVTNRAMVEAMVSEISPVEEKLMRQFWPGALTIKFRKKAGALPEVVSAGDEFVRVRLLDKGVAYRLISRAGVPVVAPSANLAGNPTGTKLREIMRDFDGKVDYIVDEGDVEDDTTSTIVQVKEGKILVIREGKISKEELAKVAPLME